VDDRCDLGQGQFSDVVHALHRMKYFAIVGGRTPCRHRCLTASVPLTPWAVADATPAVRRKGRQSELSGRPQDSGC
jgi:hypothetical protein